MIQPHLPVRLPCYDFVPITDPTLGSSPLAVGPLTLGVTDFRDVTGGVYKPRERIHRSVADLRLLATQLHEVELQTSIRTETGFLGFAPPYGIAALCTGHCSMRAAQDIRGMMI